MDEKKEMRFTFFDCQIIEGKLLRRVHRDIRWVRAEELEQYEFCPADVEVAERLGRYQMMMLRSSIKIVIRRGN